MNWYLYTWSYYGGSQFKGTRSYFSKFSFWFYFKTHHSQDVNLKFQLKRSNHLDVRSKFVYAVAYILLHKLRYGYHYQAHFH